MSIILKKGKHFYHYGVASMQSINEQLPLLKEKDNIIIFSDTHMRYDKNDVIKFRRNCILQVCENCGFDTIVIYLPMEEYREVKRCSKIICI